MNRLHRVRAALTCAALLCLAPAVARAQEMKPLFLISLSGYDALKADIGYVGGILGQPEMAQSLEGLLALFTQGQGLAGLDKSKPWGASVRSDGAQFQVLAFVPVTDVKKLMTALSGVIGQTREEDGVYEIERETMTLYVKEASGWAYLSQTPEGLENLPEDPAALLGRLPKQYDVAVRLNWQNIPEQFRQMGMDQLRSAAQQASQRQPGESDQAFADRQRLQGDLQTQFGMMEALLAGLDEMIVGLAVDESARQVYLDFAFTALEGSSLAEQLASTQAAESHFGGFVDDDAVAFMHVNQAIDESAREQLQTQIETGRTQANAQIDGNAQMPTEAKAAVKALLGQIFDVAAATVEAGHLNGGFVVRGAGPFTAVAGGVISGGMQLEQSIKQAVAQGRGQPGFPTVELDKEQFEGLNIHQIRMAIPPQNQSPELTKILGTEAVLTLAFAEDRAFVAIGADGIDVIKQVVTDSAASGSELAPMELSVKLGPIMEVVGALVNNNPTVDMMVESLGEGDQDHVRILTRFIKRGQMVRLTLEESVVKMLIGAAQSTGLPGGVAPPVGGF